MLSKSIANPIEDKLNHFLRCVKSIPSDQERNHIERLVFTKCPEHKIKLLPPEYSWGVHVDFLIVIDVQIMIFTIILCLNNLTLIHSQSVSCRSTLRELYLIFKECLREFGTSSPPFKLGSSYKKTDLLKTANYIKYNFMRSND